MVKDLAREIAEVVLGIDSDGGIGEDEYVRYASRIEEVLMFNLQKIIHPMESLNVDIQDKAYLVAQTTIHEGSILLIKSTNDKYIGWVDMHKIMGPITYREQILDKPLE